MLNSIKHFFLASFNEQELDEFIKDTQDAKASALDKMYAKAQRRANARHNHSSTFHSVVSSIKGLGLSKEIKQELVSDWLEEATS